MIDPSLLRRLKDIVGPEHVSSGRADREVYSYDASLVTGMPDAVVLPADTDQTAAVVRAATEARVPYLPRGFATNLSGGSVSVRGGLVIQLSRLNRILDVRPEGRYAVAQPGVTNLELQNALAPLGYYYAPDPASQKVATLGGNVGENSGGPHCLKYGVTGNHVLGVTVVLPGGQVVQSGVGALDPPGYDLRGVLVGSEGTLGIVTELVVRILPSAESVLTLLVVYDDNADAARSVSDIIAAGIVPATLEMMDATVMRAVEESMPCGYPLDAAAVLIVEVDGPGAGLARQADQIAEICTRNGCREVRKAKDAAERNLLWAGRRGAFGAIARLAPNYLVADCTVPRTGLPEALARVAAIAQEHKLAHGNVFHAGDGNLHPLLLFDSRDPEQLNRVHEAGHQIMEACVALGGTITGEHGVGVEKAEAMRMVFSEDDLDFQRRLRTAFDPDDLLNPGKIIPPAAPAASEEPGEPRSPEIPLDGELVPADVQEACEIVRQASLDRAALLPLGSGLRQDFGNQSERPVTRLRSTKLSGVVEYDPANQVIAAGAGMSLDSLQEVLAEHGQWLPLRPPFDGRTTVGGIAALNACGPERLRYGSPRDLALGLKFVSGTGRLISAGGRVVKNVTGYDLTRLLVGSAGTLGFITEVTFRVAPIPQRCVAVVASGTWEQCRAGAAELLGSQLEPNSIVAEPLGGGLRTCQFIAGFEGFEETVAFQTERCDALLAASGLSVEERAEYATGEGVCKGRVGILQFLDAADFAIRVDLPPDGVVPFLSAHRDALCEPGAMADLGCGRIIAPRITLSASVWTEICEAATQVGGHAVLEKAPRAFRAKHDVFGPPRANWQLMHKIKAALDPRDVFAPGRLPGRK